MKFWIQNIDGGFRGEIHGVSKNIVCAELSTYGLILYYPNNQGWYDTIKVEIPELSGGVHGATTFESVVFGNMSPVKGIFSFVVLPKENKVANLKCEVHL